MIIDGASGVSSCRFFGFYFVLVQAVILGSPGEKRRGKRREKEKRKEEGKRRKYEERNKSAMNGLKNASHASWKASLRR